jgi:hypothetical protein
LIDALTEARKKEAAQIDIAVKALQAVDAVTIAIERLNEAQKNTTRRLARIEQQNRGG